MSRSIPYEVMVLEATAAEQSDPHHVYPLHNFVPPDFAPTLASFFHELYNSNDHALTIRAQLIIIFSFLDTITDTLTEYTHPLAMLLEHTLVQLQASLAGTEPDMTNLYQPHYGLPSLALPHAALATCISPPTTWTDEECGVSVAQQVVPIFPKPKVNLKMGVAAVNPTLKATELSRVKLDPILASNNHTPVAMDVVDASVRQVATRPNAVPIPPARILRDRVESSPDPLTSLVSASWYAAAGIAYILQ